MSERFALDMGSVGDLPTTIWKLGSPVVRTRLLMVGGVESDSTVDEALASIHLPVLSEEQRQRMGLSAEISESHEAI